MPQSKLSLTRAVANHRGAFVTSLAIGALLMLGVRSLFVGADGSPTMAAAATATDHHAEPGHEGHAHDAAPTAPDDEGHGSHGEKKDGDAHDGRGVGDGAGDGADQENSDQKKEHDGDAAEEAKFVPTLLDLGNEMCPVMGGEADGETFTEWNGLRVGHCCPGCRERFLKNPESLLDDASPKWRDAAAAAKAIDAAEGDERKALIKKAAKTWTVVREPVGKQPTDPAGLLIDLGNEACPVMGGDVNGQTFTEWNGLRVGHCCPGCSKRFLANPEALLDEVAPDWRDAAAAVRTVNEAKGAAQEKALAKLEKKWKVVREPAAERSK